MEVNSFWDGGRLTTLEQLCISSFLANGIGFNLYVYDSPASVPPGATLDDAAEIVPREQLFRYAHGEFNLGSVSGFSNLFSYSLIAQRGGWWADTDVCCVVPFDFDGPEIYFSEASTDGTFLVAAAIFKAPPQSPVLLCCLELFRAKDVTRIVHGETGPGLLTDVITASGDRSKVLQHQAFFPVPWWEYRRLFEDESLDVSECSAVHFWNAMICAANLDLDATYGRGTVFERLKRRYLL